MSAPHLQHIAALIANDSHACSFQSLGQYRAALLKEIAQASAAPEQEAVYQIKDEAGDWIDVSAETYSTCLDKPGNWQRRKLYTNADPSEVERLRADLKTERLRADEAQALLAKVINSGALSDDRHEELEADICAAVDVVATLKKQAFADQLESEAEKAIAMPDYKRECVKSPGLLSATAQPAEVKS